MKQHRSKFDEHHLKLSRNKAAGLPDDAGFSLDHLGKLREGRVGGYREGIPPSIVQKLDERWLKDMEPVTGFKTYEEMRRAVNEELSRPWAI